MNIEAGIAELGKLSASPLDVIKAIDLGRILTAMKTPEQCKHARLAGGDNIQTFCLDCKQPIGKTEPTLAKKDIYQDFKNKIKVRCCKHGEVAECVYCMSIKEYAIEHFAPLIEKARKEGYKEAVDKGFTGEYVTGCIDGKRQTTQELKERFALRVIRKLRIEADLDYKIIDDIEKELFGANHD